MTSKFRTLLLLGAASASMAQFAAADVLTGTVTDQTGEAPLQGAILTLEELGRSVSSDRFGEFRFPEVPAGEYTLSASYIGTDTVTQTVTVDGVSEFNVVLGQDVRYLDNILVVGSAAAQAGAINQQRASNAIISVIDSDGLGNFPDTTVADSLRRVPGLSIENDQGEGRYVSIRGINTDLIATTINGVRTPSPEDRRGVLLDGVPSDLLDGIEVQKSLTPDVDADTLGGVINLKTISAFDRDGQFFRAKVEGSYNEITEEISPKGTLTYSNTFLDDRLGVAASFNYQQLQIESHNNETGGWEEDDGEFLPEDDFEQRWYDLTRERTGLVFNVDFKAAEHTDLYLRTLYNYYVDDEVRNKFEIRDVNEDITSLGNGIYSLGFTEVDYEVRQREETRTIQTYALGGQSHAGNWTYDYELSYAYAEEDDSDNHDVNFRTDEYEGDGILGFDFNGEQPVFDGPILATLLDPANAEMDAYEQEFTVNEDTEWTLKFDVTNDAILGDTPVQWKAGIKLRDREKVRDENKLFWERDDIVLSDFIASTSPIDNWRLANDMFAWPDAGLTRALRGTFTADEFQEDDSNFDSLAEDYKIDENIYAGYFMGTFDIDALTIVAGVRLEVTDVEAVGNVFAEEAAASSVGTREYSDVYSNILPSVNLKYQFNDRLIGRAAYYATVLRPAFGEMRPTIALNDDRDEAALGNPNLEPYEGDNFDLSIEYYPTKLSVLSAGVFHKEIQNAIFPATFDIEDVPASVDLSFLDADTLAGLEEIETFINVGSSELTGVEFNYVQQFDFLGGYFEGFLASANLTLVDSESTLPDGREVPLLKQNDTIWNVAVGYDKGPWDVRVSALYRGDYLDEVFDANVDRYTSEHLTLEASAKYDINDQFQIFLEGKNLNDEPEYYYHGNESRLSQYDEFGTTVVFGARYTY